MTTSHEILNAAMSQSTDEELREIINSELRDETFETSNLRLLIASDLICDAALEVFSQLSKEPSVKKIVALGSEAVQLSEMPIVGDLTRLFENGKVSMNELEALLHRSAVYHAFSEALENGLSKQDLTRAEFSLAPVGLSQFIHERPTEKNPLKRLFGGRQKGR